ncbi:MAG: DUF4258 domain-containing protein [Nitrospirota bacterium]
MSAMKMIKYTTHGHAKNRMRLHRIEEAEIESAIDNPEFTEQSSEGKLNVWKRASEKYLRMTFKEEAGKVLIITAVKKKKGWG